MMIVYILSLNFELIRVWLLSRNMSICGNEPINKSI